MNLTDLISEVYTITKRPDLSAETKQAVKAATLKFHQMDYWSKDIFETGISFLTAEYIQQLDLSVINRYRAIKYLRKCDSQGVPQLGQKGFFKIKTPDQVLDKYGADVDNIAYVAGDVINLRSDTQFQYLLTGFYVNPDITDSGFSSWIADNHPYLIIHEAASKLYSGAIGKNQEAAAEAAERNEQLSALYTSNLIDQGS